MVKKMGKIMRQRKTKEKKEKEEKRREESIGKTKKEEKR